MERLVDTSKSIHDKMLKFLTKKINNQQIKDVIDAGSGKTSASLALKFFPLAEVDAIIYPGDNRKKNPLETAIGSDRLQVVEADIVRTEFNKEYDICLVHFSLGEALHWNNSFENLFHHIMDIKARYFIIIDNYDDPCVHYRYMEQYFKEMGFKIVKKKKFKNPNPEHYPKVKFDKYKLEFDTNYFLGYLIENLNVNK